MSGAVARFHRAPVVVPILLATLTLLVLPSGVAAATAGPTASSPLTVWAYGGVRTAEFHGNTHLGWEYHGNATYGYSVVLSQTNTSATTFELSINRSMGALFEVHYCYPSCTAGIFFGNVSAHLYETTVASANLTTEGWVYENGNAVAAIALNNSHSHLLANATETRSSYLPLALGMVAPRSAYVSGQVVASSFVDFSPGLGILPTNLPGSASWNSTAQFNAQATATYAWFAQANGPQGSVRDGPVTGNLSVPAQGNVSVFGSYAASHTVDLGGISFPEVSLAIVGPFALREGFLPVPHGGDLFDGASLPWAAHQNASATAAMSYLDARTSEGGHFGVGASQWVYDSSTIRPTSVASGSGGTTQIAPATGGGADSAPPTTVQGTPESVQTAQSQQTCLVTGSGCTAGTTSGGLNLRGLAGLLGIVVVAVVALGVVVLVAERRRMPPTVYPNAALYPPGATAPPPAAPRTPARPPPPAEEDPLRNLW